jgi:peptidylprolyl isomerase
MLQHGRRRGARTLLAAACLGGIGVAAARGAGLDAATAAPGLYAVFETTLGDFVCELEPDKAPVTVGNFVGLAEGTQEFEDPATGRPARRPFYDGLLFHRVVRGFVVQGGCPRNDGTSGPGYTFTDEIDPSLHHDRPGVLSMASSEPNQNGSQFFITLAPAPHLDGHHSIFGRVVHGLEVLQRLEREPVAATAATGEKSRPRRDLVMKRVRIVRTGPEALAFDAGRAFDQRKDVAKRMRRQREASRRRFEASLKDEFEHARVMSNGVRFVVLRPGAGARPRPGDFVTTHCIGYLADGTKFWSSLDRGRPFEVQLGMGKLVRGWEEAYLDMQPGEKRRLIVPPALGYGARGNERARIPRNATLVLDLELLSIDRR